MKKELLLAASLLIAGVLSGCGEVAYQPAPSAPAATETVPAQREASMTVYVTDDDGMKLAPRTVKVSARDKNLKNALFQMILLDREQTFRVLPTGLTVKDVNITSDGTAIIDLSKELKNLGGGNTTQGLFIAMFVNTATEFPNVKQVLFRMEGEPIDRLTGHYDMTEPFRRDETLIRMEKT